MKKILYASFALLFSTTSYAAGDIAAGKAKSVSCVACHGANGKAAIPGYPNIGGQNEQYLVTSMLAYKKGERTGSLANIMKLQMQVLSETDIKNLAAYFASLK